MPNPFENAEEVFFEQSDPRWGRLPYVAWMNHDGDFSWNSNNYVHGPMARIKPRK